MSSLTRFYVQPKRKSRKPSSHSTLSLLRKELREGNLHSIFGGSSCVVPSSNVAPDPLLSSFILPTVEDYYEDVQSTDLFKKSITDIILDRLYRTLIIIFCSDCLNLFMAAPACATTRPFDPILYPFYVGFSWFFKTN
ncbi:protein dehydration-induced 19 [Phtheirospermum japonicum]|uniref:Protein dehydration-induced 19 n=1 Tax=Phtheirospermum japonicum TaxID=374723 RepID=A0A830CVX4_9LAMI|nr:protein dehydration-induced 19 [Phtheirospermum japonicum]